MNDEFPSAVPEIPVNHVGKAAQYYEDCLGFQRDWGAELIGQVSRGRCRIFLTDGAFRRSYASVTGPVVIWLNLDGRNEVDALYDEWKRRGARLASEPEAKPWHLHEFIARDIDGNLLRVFYDFAWELPDRGGRSGT